MANYHYDEAGNMAAYFLLSFLAIALIPLTLSISTSKKKSVSGCQCEACIQQRKTTIAKLEANSWLNPLGLTKKGAVILFGWLLFAFVCYRVASLKQDNKVYDPFEILGIRSGTSEKDIKSHFKKLSKKFHPDKVKLTVNETMEMVQERFVQITKAYKSLTDETIRKNLELWGHPDGRQEMSMGIALPAWIIEGKNNIWVLGFYGLVFGAGLPALVGRWWFGSQAKTKDGINVLSAASLFKNLKDDSNMDEVVGTLGKAYQWDYPRKMKQSADVDATLDRLVKEIKEKAGNKWESVSALVGVKGAEDKVKRRALILLYAHLLRLPIERKDLQTEQSKVVLQTPVLLNALLSMSTSRNWLLSTVSILRLHAYFAQALLPSPGSGSSRVRFAQLPGIKVEEVELDGSLAPKAKDYRDFVKALEANGDARSMEAKKAVDRWGRLDVVDAYFKVIGERIIVPSAIVFLVLKLRLVPPLYSETPVELTEEELKQSEEKDREFLTGPNIMEQVVFKNKQDPFGYAHAPHWPGNRTPGWWIVLADEKGNKLVLPPTRIAEVPFSGTMEGKRDYRTYRIQFQAPNGAGALPWKVYFISDTFVGEEVYRNMTLNVEDWSALTTDEQRASEDEISDPDEDTLAGQMAAMRGSKVKKIAHGGEDEDSDEESTTDGDKSDSSDSSDSDSD